MAPPDFTNDAEALFERFADRHGLRYVVRTDIAIDVCWELPEQPKLCLPVTLGLQNGDVLNFGLPDFWSGFFPFSSVAERFESIIDAWVEGNARVAVTGKHGRMLQIREGDGWQTVYRANVGFFPLRPKPRAFVSNLPIR